MNAGGVRDGSETVWGYVETTGIFSLKAFHTPQAGATDSLDDIFSLHALCVPSILFHHECLDIVPSRPASPQLAEYPTR